MCPSHFTAGRVRDLLGVDEQRLRVVPHGHRLPPTATPEVGQRVRAVRADRGRFVLYPAIAYPHKRHLDLVRVLARLDPDLDDLSVVFTGRPGPETPALVEEAERLGVAKRVKILGRVPRHELNLLYRAAQALVFPSSYEGFGNPVLEAMGLSCPVVAADAGALPEVVGDAGVIYPVADLDALANAITEVVSEPEVAEALRAAGRLRAAGFDADIAAAALGAVYREASDTGL
jgi:alpha-1,3-rhamnosyl/mannosyltransferase